MQNIDLQYPTWYILFCLIAGLAAAVLLYRRDTAFVDQAPVLRYVMAALRGIVVSILAFLLLSPLMKLMQTRSEPPIIVIAQDQSTSVLEGMSDEDSLAYMKSLTDLTSRLEEKFIVHKIGFGEDVINVDHWTIDDQASDLGQLMTYYEEQYRGQNVGALIVASDGAINRGKNPLYESGIHKAPLSVIAMGDTLTKTDLQVRNVFHNSLAYLGDKFTIQVDISADQLAGSSSVLEIRHLQEGKNELLERIPVDIDSQPWFSTREFTIEAGQSGVQRYRVQLAQVRNEITYTNNVKDFFVEVIDGRLNVLLLANSPHPDLAVWKAALLEQRNYEVSIEMAAGFDPGNLKNFDLVVLHQLPSSKHLIQPVLDEIEKLELPKIIITGYQTDLYAFNYAQTLLKIDNGDNRVPNEVTMIYNPEFSSFHTSEDLQTKLQTFSPLYAPYGEYTSTPSAQVLAYQRIGRVETQFPLILIGEENDVRTVVIAGEGVWKWQLYDQLQNGSKEITFELLNQLCQYASTKSDKRKFRVTSPKKLYTELEEIVFQAELYNDNYELTNAPEVLMIIRNAQRQEFDYTFNTSAQSYHLDIGRFTDGSYTYTATTELNGVRHSYDGKFVVQPVQLEALTSTADHGLLRQLADRQGGKFVYADQMASLADDIIGNEQIKPVMYSSTRTRPLIHLKWLCLVLLAGICMEWFLRRFYGGY